MFELPPVPEVDWEALEAVVRRRGITLDRPRGSRHPVHPAIIYPIDYGFVNDTPGEDGEGLDVFVGTGEAGLVGVARTIDRRKGDTELKLLWGCTPAEVYLVHGFLNFAPAHMTASLALREPLAVLWERRGLG